ncbi:MAG: MopE-related protein [Myxococcota bacterium]|nr:MopE-related protein [Myxococcota bacterium]
MFIWLIGCWVSDWEIERGYSAPIKDNDGDGFGAVTEDPNYTSGEDCNDDDPNIYPDASELCDGVDNNCNGEVDEDATTIFYFDRDGDGYGGDEDTLSACEPPEGYSERGRDCNDSPSTLKGYTNADGTPIPDGYFTHPNAAENEENAERCMEDADEDGFGAPLPNGCCFTIQLRDLYEDGWNGAYIDLYHNAQLSTRFTHLDGPLTRTNFCVPEGTASFTFTQAPHNQGIQYIVTKYGTDIARSGELSPTSEIPEGLLFEYECTASEYTIETGSDCDDQNSSIIPSVSNNNRICTLDQDADGQASEFPPLGYIPGEDCHDGLSTVYKGSVANELGAFSLCALDLDGDQYGSNRSRSGFDAGTDCDDHDAETFPGSAQEAQEHECMMDKDGDGFGSDHPPDGFDAGSDCNDWWEDVYPGSIKSNCETNLPGPLCSNDCIFGGDGECDDGGGNATSNMCSFGADCEDCGARQDADGDGYFDGGSYPPNNPLYTAYLDCDDENENVHPDSFELYDGIDNNCDGTIDNLMSFGADGDGDGYGVGSDCDDADPSTHPQSAHEEASLGACMRDQDGDGFGDMQASSPITAGTDCDDTDAAIHPDAIDIEDGLDNNCDGIIDNIDADGDGYDGLSDCNDSDPTVYPNAMEICDGIFNDCNHPSYDPSSAPSEETDDDGDFYVECDLNPNTWVGSLMIYGGGDCDDTTPSIGPDATEIDEDGIDQNCDGLDFNALCTETCTFSMDGYCDDGGANAEYSVCDFGSDCTDCGFRRDADGDGYYDAGGVPVDTTLVGYVDCDDSNPLILPGGIDIDNDGIDQDCDGSDFTDGLCSNTCSLAKNALCEDDSVCAMGTDCSDCGARYDSDGDGFYADIEDCDDENASIHPAADEDCFDTYFDNDCNDMTICYTETAAAFELPGGSKNRFADRAFVGSLQGQNHIALGCPQLKNTTSNQAGVGGLYLFTDLLNSTSISDATLSVTTDDGAQVQSLGESLWFGEDLNEDGIEDLLVSQAMGTTRGVYFFHNPNTTSHVLHDGSVSYDAYLDLSQQGAITADINVGDLTGDGSLDVIIGTPDANSGSGAAFIIFDGLSTLNGQEVLNDAYQNNGGMAYTSVSGEPLSKLGNTIQIIDADGNGSDDLILSSYRQGNGQIHLFKGPIPNTQSLTSQDADFHITSLQTSEGLGSELFSGDVTADGIPELLALAADTTPQRLYLYDLKAIAEFELGQGSSFGDLLDLYSSFDGADYASMIFTSQGNTDFSAVSVDFIQDYVAIGSQFYNGQGMVALFPYQDLLGYSNTQKEVLFSANQASRVFLGANNSRLGSLVQNIGDIDGDGYEDLLIGSNNEQSGAGVVRIEFGPF